MKSVLAVPILLLLLVASANAQWAIDGVPVTEVPGQVQFIKSAPDGAGGMLVAWTDQRVSPASQSIYVQRINSAGVALWGANGTVLCTAANTREVSAVVTDGAGGAIVVWRDFRTGANYDIYARRIDSNGFVQGIPNGVAVCTALNDKSSARAVPDGSGGAVIVWSDRRSGSNYNIFAQRINFAGTSQWAANGIALAANAASQDQAEIAAIGGGQCVVVWRDFRFGASDTDIFAQSVNLAGNILWNPTGLSVCGPTGNQAVPRIDTDGMGGAVMAWEDQRGVDSDIYAQRVDAFGNLFWVNNGVALCTAASNQVSVAITGDGAGGAAVAWLDLRSGTFDVYGQYVSAAGAPAWTFQGAPVCTASLDQLDARVVRDGSGGFVFCWSDLRSATSGQDIYAQRINATGSIQWQADGLGVSRAPGTQSLPVAIADGAGGTMLAWSDARSGVAQVFANRVDNVHGFPGHPEPSITQVADIRHDQGGKVAVNWTASSNDLITPRNIDFYSVWRAVDAVPSGAQVVTIDEARKPGTKLGRNIYLSSPGYYFEQVGTQPAHGWPGYSFAAETRADSISGATNNEVFMVAAHYSGDDFVAFASNTMSGHSVDNLAPPAPSFLTAQRVGSGVQLRWGRVRVADLRNYSVYRSTSGGVTPDPANFLASGVDTFAVDSNPPSGAVYYIVTANDVHANQGIASSEAAVGSSTGVGDTPALTQLEVLPNHPNPFAGSTQLNIGLPKASDVRVEVYDVAGRRVSKLEERGVAAGWRQIQFTPRDESGRALASGVYFYRVHAAGTTITRKMVITR